MSASVRGLVSLPADAPERRAARVLVEVRDVSAADAPSVVVGTQVQTDVPLRPGGRFPFHVEVPDLDPRASYGLRVHIDLEGSGLVESGDLINTQVSPVPVERPDRLVAPVRAV
ncbi:MULTISPECIES: YbaY family lipoprotein [Streptomyces]|uniref:YbaY family lipoprotein n=1 Tax=Streptomyces TaxID=1883 RepID=UPI00292D3458|nr:YbaY family lipoprotein [Streptomyces sp. NEAU-HV9]